MSRDIKFQMMFSEDEMRRIDDFRFANRINTRAGAVRSMIAHVELASIVKDLVKWRGKREPGTDDLLPPDQQEPEIAAAMWAILKVTP